MATFFNVFLPVFATWEGVRCDGEWLSTIVQTERMVQMVQMVQVHGHDPEHAISKHFGLVRADSTLHLWRRHSKGPLGGLTDHHCLFFFNAFISFSACFWTSTDCSISSCWLFKFFFFTWGASLWPQTGWKMDSFRSHCSPQWLLWKAGMLCHAGCAIPGLQAGWTDRPPGEEEGSVSLWTYQSSITDARFVTTSQTSNLVCFQLWDMFFWMHTVNIFVPRTSVGNHSDFVHK